MTGRRKLQELYIDDAPIANFSNEKNRCARNASSINAASRKFEDDDEI
jgi:hypothetical protein